MDRIIWHWTAGGHKANATDRKSYHFIIEADGTVIEGDYPVSANESTATPYAKHTLNLNTGSISISAAGMRGAKERPFNAGPSPITTAEVDGLVKKTAELCRQYNIPVTRETTLSHAEVKTTLGVWQRPKWDIAWLPGMSEAGDPIAIGDQLRARVLAEMEPPKAQGGGLVAALMAFVRSILGGRA